MDTQANPWGSGSSKQGPLTRMVVGVVKEGFLEELTSKMTPDGSVDPLTLFLGSSLSTPQAQSGTESCPFCFRDISVPTRFPGARPPLSLTPSQDLHISTWVPFPKGSSSSLPGLAKTPAIPPSF